MCKSITGKWTSNRFPGKLHKFRNWSLIVLIRAGYYGRTLLAPVGKLELRKPGRLRSEVFEQYQHSAKRWSGTLVEIVYAGGAMQKVKAIAEELCGREFSASIISRVFHNLDEEVDRFAVRQLGDLYPYSILDERYEAVMVAIGCKTCTER